MVCKLNFPGNGNGCQMKIVQQSLLTLWEGKLGMKGIKVSYQTFPNWDFRFRAGRKEFLDWSEDTQNPSNSKVRSATYICTCLAVSDIFCFSTHSMIVIGDWYLWQISGLVRHHLYCNTLDWILFWQKGQVAYIVHALHRAKRFIQLAKKRELELRMQSSDELYVRLVPQTSLQDIYP